MDGNRFDALTKAVISGVGRRRLLAGLLGGSLASLLAETETEARRKNAQRKRQERDRETVSALTSRKKRKRRKRAKKRRSLPCRRDWILARRHPHPHPRHRRQGGDQAPPCTVDSCPLPPECSQQVLEDCSASLQEALLADAEPCRQTCQDPNAAACRECLTPIVAARLPEAKACVAQACGLPLPEPQAPSPSSVTQARQRATAQASGVIIAQGWWTANAQSSVAMRNRPSAEKMPSKSGSYVWLGACGALIAGPLGGAVLAGCVAKAIYDM